MSRRVVRSCAVASFVLVLGLASEARAQISIGGSFIYNRPGFQPAQPYQPYQPTIQPAQPYQPYQPAQPYQPTQPYQPYPPTQPTIQPYPPTQPGIGGPSYPYPPNPYDPNGVANASSSTAMYWDPARGWVSNTQNTQTLNSFYSPARNTIMPGTSVQTYTYWNGTQYAQGTRWLGVDGQWHGDQTNTVVRPDGSTTTNTVYRSVNPNARGAAPATAPAPATTPAPGFGSAPIFRQP